MKGLYSIKFSIAWEEQEVFLCVAESQDDACDSFEQWVGAERWSMSVKEQALVEYDVTMERCVADEDGNVVLPMGFGTLLG